MKTNKRHLTPRTPNLKKKKNALRWFQKNPNGYGHFEMALRLLKKFYVGDQHGYIDRKGPPEYRFNSHGEGYTTIRGSIKHSTVRFVMPSEKIRAKFRAEHSKSIKNRFGIPYNVVDFKISDSESTSRLKEFLSSPSHKIENFSHEASSKRTQLASLKKSQIPINLTDKEIAFFSTASDTPATGTFSFKSGHKEKKTGLVQADASKKNWSIQLVHNELQTALYKKLVLQYGKQNVGTEITTGQGTAIDVVVKNGRHYLFYEIKTANSIKSCIRQAIPQLLEYAYWNTEDIHVKELIIVGPKKVTAEAKKYLTRLQQMFELPIRYEHLKIASKL